MMCRVNRIAKLSIDELYQGFGMDMAVQVDVIVRNHLH